MNFRHLLSCDTIALACADASDDVNFIKDVEANLKHLWKFFENSSKKLQLTLKHKKSKGEKSVK